MRKNNSIRGRLSRRQYAQLVAGAGLAGLAGCNDQSGDGTPTEGDGTATATSGDGGTQDTDTPGDATETEQGTPEGEPVTDTIRFAIDNNAEQFNANTWQQGDNSGGVVWLTELFAGQDVDNQEMKYNPTFDAPWHPEVDEIEVATWFTGYDVEPPYDKWEYLNENLTFWDGTPIDAEVRLTDRRLNWFWNDNKFAEGETFNHEVVSQWEYHRWNDKGEVDGQEANPQSRTVLELDTAPNDGDFPMHPDFTEPYVQEYEDASTEDAAQSVKDDLVGDRVSAQQLAENDWGSGLYRIESPDDVGSERVQLSIRDDHPNAEHANVSNLELLFASQDRQQVLAGQGEIDMHGNIVQETGGQYNREMLPDHMQELSRWLQIGGDKWLFNWNNPHLENLWVRRALVAAVDWPAAGENGWGAERSIPIEYQTGLLDPVNRKEFSEDFLDSLHSWPMEADQETAAEYMQRAGYERQGGQWVDPDGNSFELDLTATTQIQDYIGAAQTIQANLQSFGVGVNYTGQGWDTWIDSMDTQNNPSLNYDTTIYWHGGQRAFQYYWTQGGPWTEALIGGDPNDDTDVLEVDYEDSGDRTRDTEDIQGKPLQVQIPEDPSDIEAPDEAGLNPDIGGEEIDLARIVHRLREDIDEDEYQDLIEKCARYYNYYLPDFVFHQYTWGTWGNVRDFEWPESNHKAIRTEHGFSVEDFVIQGGIVQPSYDEEFEEP